VVPPQVRANGQRQQELAQQLREGEARLAAVGQQVAAQELELARQQEQVGF
jgi:hypothetical protein